MKQKIYPDPHGLDTWDENKFGRIYVHIVNSMMYREITGQEPPQTPVTAKLYTQYGLPWFDLYDDQMGIFQPPQISKRSKLSKRWIKKKASRPSRMTNLSMFRKTKSSNWILIQIKKLKTGIGKPE